MSGAYLLKANANNIIGIVTPANGGTGVSNPPANTVPIAEGAAPYHFVGPGQGVTGLNGQVLMSGGAGTDPHFSTPRYPDISVATGRVLMSDGLNVTYSTAPYPSTCLIGQLIVATANLNFSNLAAGTNGQILIGSTNAIPVFAAPTGTQGIVWTGGAGTINAGLTAVPNSALANSSITINGSTVSLGGSTTVNANSIITTTFTSNGSWTINPGTKIVEFFVWSGGGGGGSGRCGASGTAGGGAGGASGNFMYQKTLASLVTASPYTVTIGTGGAGGTSINAVATNGNPGTAGNPSTIGTLIQVVGGSGGPGGVTTIATGPASLYYTILAVVVTANAGNGSNSLAAGTASLQYGWATGGGGGSGYSAATARIGGAGGAINDANGNLLVAGGLAGSNAGATAGNGNSPSSIGTLVGGTGGGGGGCDGVSVAGTGGNGAFPSGGGGGGGGNLSSNASGAGGNGANGQIIIVEYL